MTYKPQLDKVSSTDTTPGNLVTKLVAGSNVTITKNNPGANETLTLAASGGGGGSFSSPAYFTYLAALLEPLALEPAQSGTFTYAIGAGVTKILLGSYWTRLGAAGRMETRNPQQPFPMRGLTLYGLDATSIAIFLDPSLPVFSNPFTTYYDRLNTLATNTPQKVDIVAASTSVPLLPGPYGSIITQITNFDYTWLAAGGPNKKCYNLWEEVDDNYSFRYGHSCFIPVSKFTLASVLSGITTRTPLATLVYYICPSTWGTVVDSISYLFRDDFMSAALDTSTKWNRTQSSAGNMEIDTLYQWCKSIGNTNWGTNGIYSKFSTARSVGRVFLTDVFANFTGADSTIMGWSDGGGYSYTNFAHGLNFNGNSLTLGVYENGNNRGAVGAGMTKGAMYRVRITLGAANATYEIQGGPEYAALGSSSWTNITPGTTSSSTTPLYVGITAYDGSMWVGDVRVY